MKATKKTKVKRSPKRGFYDKETIYRILDNHFICQIAFVHEGYPVVIPTIFGRDNENLFIHGAMVSKMLHELEKGLPISINVTQTDGIVLARSAFHHSLNYQSVTIFGNAFIVSDPKEQIEALKVISDQIIPDRWSEVRLPNKKELNVTKILKIPITEASAKIRTGPPIDDKSDYSLPVWAGVIPMKTILEKPIADPVLDATILVPESVKKLLKNKM